MVNRQVGLVCLALAACGSSSPPAAPLPAPVAPAVRPRPPIDEHARHDEIAAAHRKIEEEQQEALAATCPSHDAQPRCLPSCYASEPADVRAGKKRAGTVEIAHLVCEQPGDRHMIADEIDGAKLALRGVRGRIPPAHKKGTWQEALETAFAAEQKATLGKGDVVRVTSGWRAVVHPASKERLRCVTVSHYARSLRRPLDACGADGAVACEATGSAVAHGINVVHYRLAEARLLQGAGKPAECQQAAQEAVAVARGMPRWRQYMKLNVATWVDHAGYRTRFDGTLDEDTLFATAEALGRDAEAVYTACGGPTRAPTTAAEEQSFHTCW
jgi:hypothetical protein